MFELPVSKPALMLLVWLVWLGLFLPPACGAQQTQMHPVLVAACEGTDGCARWDFHGPSGSGQWPNGAVADLTIQRFDANDGGTVVIRRVDSSGAASGLTATYTGTRTGVLVSGKVAWNWPGHGDQSTGETDFRAVVLQDFMNAADVAKGKSLDIPDILSMCEKVDGCSSWHMNGKQGQGSWDDGAIADLTVERFDDSAVVIRRSDSKGLTRGLSGLYVGAMVDGKIIGVVTLSWPGHAPDGITSWEATMPAPPASLPPVLTIDQIHDEVLPAPTLPALPVPPAAAPFETKGLAGFDLNGSWTREGSDPNHAETLSILQLGDKVAITHIIGRDNMPANSLFIDATYDGASTATGTANIAEISNTPGMVPYPVKVTVMDADHIQTSPQQANMDFLSARYVRGSSASVQDVPCEPSNAHHISGNSAFQRGEMYLRKKDVATANCWFYIGGHAGNADALAEYGRSLYEGRGIPKQQELAAAFMLQAAMHGSAQASGYVSFLFGAGSVVPKSKQRHDYWFGRFQGTSTDFPHASQFFYNEGWMNVTVRPCEAGNPDHVSADDAHDMGLVAWEAESFNLAHCWMRISAEEGNTHAWAYLGLMSAFGMGVQQNLKNAFNYVYYAARKKDEFAVMYLSEFYIRGWGTERNEELGQDIANQALTLPDGFHAYSMVRGPYVSPSKAGAILIYLLNHSDCTTTYTSGRTTQGVYWTSSKTVCQDHPYNGPPLIEKPVVETPQELYPEEPFRYF
jgi:TPR repeat protein